MADDMADEQTQSVTLRTLWTNNSGQRYPALAGDHTVDVAIVGAGITGLTAAWHLKAAGLRVAIVEARRVGSGTTGSSTGNLYAPVGPRLAVLEDKHGADEMRAMAQGRVAAIDLIEQIVTAHDIPCDFKRVSLYLFSTSDKATDKEVNEEYGAAH
jgi:glycine/D-amino acid oxidase-like deaminating enzyme